MSHNLIVESGSTIRFLTEGKYCDRDIVVTAEGGSSALVLTMENPTKDVTLKEFDKIDIVCENATTIGKNAFNNCSSLTSIVLPVATSIGEYAFQDCSYLVSVDLPAATEIGKRAFSNCPALTSVSLPVAEMIDEFAFSNCDTLTSIDLPSATSIGEEAFSNCTVLTSIDLSSATSIGEGAFYNCPALISIDLPAVTSIGEYAFQDCTALDTLILRSNILCDINITAAFGTNIISAEGMPTGQGFIYVPTALYESYIADLVPKVIAFATAFGMPMDEATATYMVTMFLRKIEDYPEITGG